MTAWIINCKWLGRKQFFSDRGTIAAFTWRDWENPENTSVRTAGIQVKARTQCLPLTGLEPYSCTSLVRLFFYHSLLRPTLRFRNIISGWIYYCLAIWPTLQRDFRFSFNCILGSTLKGSNGRAVAQRLDAGFPPRRPGFAYGQHVGFVVDKAALGQVFSEYFGFPCQSFHRFLHYHNHQGLTQ
jgi:hypothetical protein